MPAFGERLLLGATSKADVIVGAGDRLYLLTGTLKGLNERVLPLNKVVRNGTSFQNGWGLAMSPHRDAALLIGSGPDLPLVAHWIDLDTLADTAVMPIANPDKVTVLNRSTVAFNLHSITDFAVHVQSMGEPPQVLCAECSDSAVLTSFGSGLLLVATKPDGAYLVTTASGEVLMRDTQGARNSHLQNGVGAVTANRTAFVRVNPIGPISLTSSDEIVVLDSDSKHVVWQYDVQQKPKPVDDWVHLRAPEIAVAPDGHKIAVLSGEQLKIFNID